MTFSCCRLVLIAGMHVLIATAVAADKFAVVPVWQIHDAEGTGPLVRPEGVACRGNRVVIADTGNARLLLFSLDGDRLSGGRVCSALAMKSPVRVHLMSTGDILAQDSRTRQVLHFDAAGELQGVLKPIGLPDSRSLWISSFAVDDADRIFLLDVAGKRVLILAADGAFQSSIPLPETDGVFSDLTVDAKGTLYVLNSVQARVYAAEKGVRTLSPLGGSLTAFMSFPTHITADRRGFLYLTDHNGGGLVRLDRNGNFRGRALTLGWKPGQLYYPEQAAVTDAGDVVVVADRGNSRVQIFRAAGSDAEAPAAEDPLKDRPRPADE